MPEDGAVALKPPNLTYDEAAAMSFGGTTALDFFRRGKLQSGERVLVNGASGGVGTAAVQLAKHFAADVTGVCSTANVELVRSLGANHVVDYTKEDFTENGETYDVIVDTVGTAPFSRSRDSLKERGRLLLVLGGLPDMLQIPWVSMTSSKKVIAGPATERSEDLRFLAALAQAGEFKPVIDRRYPFEQIAEAHRYVDTGRKKGNVIITLEHDGSPSGGGRHDEAGTFSCGCGTRDSGGHAHARRFGAGEGRVRVLSNAVWEYRLHVRPVASQSHLPAL